MERLLAALTEAGLLDDESARWVSQAQAERGGPLETVLLELDAVDEEALLRALSAAHGTPPAELDELAHADRELTSRLAVDVAVAFGLCPIRFESYGVLAWVEAPLSEERRRELRETVGLETHPRIASSHHVAAARARLYGARLSDRDEALEARLERRRGAVGLPDTLSAIASAPTLAEAVGAATSFFGDRLDVGVFLVARDAGLEVVGGNAAPWIPMPERGCAFEAALRYGGYFLGPIAGSEPDRRFFASLSRDLARCAFVAPVPTSGGPPVVFFGENGERAISARLAAEISLVTARLAQRDESWAALVPDRTETGPSSDPPEAIAAPLEHAEVALGDAAVVPDESPAMVPEPERVAVDHTAPPIPAPPTAPVVTDEERAILDRLRAAARAADVDLRTFVDRLLTPAAPPAYASSTALAGEVKDLFERLATDIPTQLARGMEAAFRDLAPRIAAGAAPAATPAAARPSVAASVELVVTEAKPREVPSYGSRRAKSKRVKL